MRPLIVQDLPTKSLEYPTLCCVAKGPVIDLSDDLGREENADSEFEPGKPSELPEYSIYEGMVLARDAGKIHESPEGTAVAILLGDEESDGARIVRIATAPRILGSVFVEVLSFGALSQLKLRDRCSNCSVLSRSDCGRESPRNLD